MVGDTRIGFMLRTIQQMKLQLGLAALHCDPFFSQCDLGRACVGNVGQEDPLPNRGSVGGRRVLHVKNVVLPIFIKNARLYFEGSLSAF